MRDNARLATWFRNGNRFAFLVPQTISEGRACLETQGDIYLITKRMNADMVNILMASRRAVDRLGVRFAIVLAVALLPLTIVSIVRSQSVMSEARAQAEASVDGETLRAVSSELALIEEAKGAAAALSQVMPQLLLTPAACQDAMEQLVLRQAFSFAGFYDQDGNVPCSNAPEPFNFGVNDNLRGQILDPRATVLVNRDAPVSNGSVIYASAPVYAPQSATLLGFVGVSVPHSALVPKRQRHTNDVAFLTLNRDGEVLTSTGQFNNALDVLPENVEIADFLDRKEPFTRMDRMGIMRTYAVIPVLNDRIFALGTWPESHIRNSGFYLDNPAFFPVLMWLASLAVAWFASLVLVTGHVVRLRDSMRLFAQKRRRVEIETFAAAPQELREVAQAHIEMTDQLMRDEATLEDNVRQKEVLLREVHHRVKNNLQLIASIMNMQMRQSRSPEVKQLMRGLHDRVLSLATIHRGLYQTTGVADVRMDELLADIVRQVVRIGATDEKSVDLKMTFDELHLNPDQAVPLSLMVTEALTNALKYIGSKDDHPPKLRVRLWAHEDGSAQVRIMNSLPAETLSPRDENASGLGSQLLEAFSQQLYGEIERSNDGDWFIISVKFEVEDLLAKPD